MVSVPSLCGNSGSTRVSHPEPVRYLRIPDKIEFDVTSTDASVLIVKHSADQSMDNIGSTNE